MTRTELLGTIEEYIQSKKYENLANEELRAIICETMKGTSKRVRPMLCCIGCKLFAPISEHTLEMAYAIELFHNFTLIHDDIMDEAPLRRYKPSVYKQYGKDVALLIGDMVQIEAYEALNNLPVDVRDKIMPMFNRTAKEVCVGQYYDLQQKDSKHGDSLSFYLEMIKLKTAVLLASSMFLGARVAGAKENDCQLLYDAGLSLGMAFQIRDDYLDIYGGSHQTGKQIGGDIIQRKETLPFILACTKATSSTKEKLRTLMDEYIGEDKVEKMTKIYDTLELKTDIRKIEESYIQKTQSAINCLSAPEKEKQFLLDYACYLLNRIS